MSFPRKRMQDDIGPWEGTLARGRSGKEISVGPFLSWRGGDMFELYHGILGVIM